MKSIVILALPRGLQFPGEFLYAAIVMIEELFFMAGYEIWVERDTVLL